MANNGVCYKESLPNCIASDEGKDNGILWTYKPKGTLARILYEKQQQDQYLSKVDKLEWYECNLRELPENISSKFIQLGPDEETVGFLLQSEEKSDWILTQLWHSLAKALLSWFMTQTSINGWLQRGSMFVVSTAQFQKLLNVDDKWRAESLLDLGAGDGEVTARMANFFDQIYTTEVSPTMRNLLQRRGYRILEVESWYIGRQFDVISCLNLLDRCDTPIEILTQIKTALKPNGRVLLALVVPFSAYVEAGGAVGHKPKELLPITGKTFEAQVQSLVRNVLEPVGFEVESWSRVPYLCEGDLHQSYYWLDDVILVLKTKSDV